MKAQYWFGWFYAWLDSLSELHQWRCHLLYKVSTIFFYLSSPWVPSLNGIYITWMICTRNHLSRVITQNQETVAMTSTAVSKRVFKSQTALKWRWTNVQCNVCFLLIWCIYRYIFLLNTLSGGKSGSVAPGVAVAPWVTETVLSPWLAADEDRVSHVLSHVVWWKKNIANSWTCGIVLLKVWAFGFVGINFLHAVWIFLAKTSTGWTFSVFCLWCPYSWHLK